MSPRPVQLFFLQRPGIVLATQQSAVVYDAVWENYPLLERLFGCQTMQGAADLRLDFTFEPEVRLARNIQVMAVKSDAL